MFSSVIRDRDVVFVDIDEWCCTKLETIFPGTVVHNKFVQDLERADVPPFWRRIHLFAGIGGWEVACRMLGNKVDGLRIVTASSPCQPFSTIGQKRGLCDDRADLSWIEKVELFEPDFVFTEQVDNAIKFSWIDRVFDEMEAIGYTGTAFVLPASSVGLFHKRHRIFAGFVNVSNAIKQSVGLLQIQRQNSIETPRRRENGDEQGFFDKEFDLLLYSDSKWRPIEPGVCPLVDGFPERVPWLKAFGNAIAPPVAAIFMDEFIGAVEDLLGVDS